jgi:transcription initiation factor TFIIIB Brf1 subunit/transcription initiation factor TFIIB
MISYVTSMKTTNTIGFSNQNMIKDKPSSTFKSWNKKNKNKNTTCAKQKPNKILLQKRNRTRLGESMVKYTENVV